MSMVGEAWPHMTRAMVCRASASSASRLPGQRGDPKSSLILIRKTLEHTFEERQSRCTSTDELGRRGRTSWPSL